MERNPLINKCYSSIFAWKHSEKVRKRQPDIFDTFFSILGGATFYYFFKSNSPVQLIGANCASIGLLAFVLSEELMKRLRRRRSISQIIYVLFIFVFAHILYFYALSAIMPVSVIWQGHLGAFVTGAMLAYVYRKP